MWATVGAALKKIAVALLGNPKVLKTIGGIVLGLIIIIVMPVVAIVSIFNGDIEIDTNELQRMVVENLSAEEQANHPARFVLVEVVNIHDESLIIEPIHRVLFDVETDDLLSGLTAFYEAQGCKAYVADQAPNCAGAHCYPFYSAEKSGVFVVENPKWSIPVATMQTGLDAYLEQHSTARIDYIHGVDVAQSLGKKPGNIGFILPDIAKNDLFRGVVFDGVLPRKTFSMGEAHEKRYYMEAKMIVK